MVASSAPEPVFRDLGPVQVMAREPGSHCLHLLSQATGSPPQAQAPARHQTRLFYPDRVTGLQPSAGGSKDSPQPLPQGSVPLIRAHQVFPASMPPPVLMGSSLPHRAPCPSLSELVLSSTLPPWNVCPVHSFFL